jgi:hypothetical protein
VIEDRPQPFFERGYHVEGGKLSPNPSSKLCRSFQELVSFPIQADRAQDTPQAKPFCCVNRFFKMGTRQNGAPSVMKNLGCYGTQEELPEWAIATGGHEDDASVAFSSIGDDSRCGITTEHTNR